MKRKTYALHVTSHHNLVSDAWTADVHTLEKGIRDFPIPRGSTNECSVGLFEMAGDPLLHVNVTHRCATRTVKGWSGPGVSAAGFTHNRRFEAMPTDGILRDIRHMVFAARA